MIVKIGGNIQACPIFIKSPQSDNILMRPVRMYCIMTQASIPIIPNLDIICIENTPPIASPSTFLLAKTQNREDKEHRTRHVHNIREGVEQGRNSYVL